MSSHLFRGELLCSAVAEVIVVRLDLGGKAEVDHLSVQFLIENYVFRLDVVVGVARVVDETLGVDYLADEHPHGGFGEAVFGVE